MPGIYGIYNRQADHDRDRINKLFLSMRNVLRNRKRSVEYNVKLDEALVGKVSLPNDPWCIEPIWNHDRSTMSVLDGAIFSYTDKNGIHEVEEGVDILNTLVDEYDSTGSIDTERINGEFNLAIYDGKNQKLLIANDRWGFRELFFYQDTNIFLFAPEIKALLRHDGLIRQLDEQGVMDFLNYGYTLGNKTLIKGVSLLPPASILLIDKNGVRLESRDFEYQVTLPDDNFEEYVEKAYRLLDRAIQRRLRKRKKVAVTLSGGLDSRIIAGLLAKNSYSFDAFSLGDKHCKECAIARKVCEKMPGSSYKFAQTKPEHIPKYSEWAVWISDGAVYLSHLSSFFGALASLIKEHDILFGGFSGDLILGASFTREEDIRGVLTPREQMDRFKFRVGARHLRRLENGLFSKSMIERLNYYAEKSVEEEVLKIYRGVKTFPFQQDLFVILTRCRRRYNVDRGLIGHACVEEFYPFFDDDLFSFLYSLPPEIRMNHGLYIEIYKRFFPELAQVPWLDTGVSLYKKQPRFARWRDDFAKLARWHLKRGTRGIINIPETKNFIPNNYWYRTNKNLRAFIDGLLLDSRTLSRGYFLENGVRSLLHSFRVGLDYFEIVDRMCVFELWCRLFLDGDEKHFLSGFDFEQELLDD